MKCCKFRTLVGFKINYCTGDAKTKLFLSRHTSPSKYVLSTDVCEMISYIKNALQAVVKPNYLSLDK